MRGQDHAHPGVAGCDNHAGDGRPGQPVLTDARLVQNQDRWAVRDGTRERQASLLAPREEVVVGGGQRRQSQPPDEPPPGRR